MKDISIKKTFKKGLFIDDKLFKMFFDQGKEAKGEFAVIVGKKYGKAYERNRIKRVYREIIREKMKQSNKKFNVILLPKITSKKVTFQKIKFNVLENLKPSL